MRGSSAKKKEKTTVRYLESGGLELDSQERSKVEQAKQEWEQKREEKLMKHRQRAREQLAQQQLSLKEHEENVCVQEGTQHQSARCGFICPECGFEGKTAEDLETHYFHEHDKESVEGWYDEVRQEHADESSSAYDEYRSSGDGVQASGNRNTNSGSSSNSIRGGDDMKIWAMQEAARMKQKRNNRREQSQDDHQQQADWQSARAKDSKVHRDDDDAAADPDADAVALAVEEVANRVAAKKQARAGQQRHAGANAPSEGAATQAQEQELHRIRNQMAEKNQQAKVTD
jgi:hypothetical protein